MLPQCSEFVLYLLDAGRFTCVRGTFALRLVQFFLVRAGVPTPDRSQCDDERYADDEGNSGRRTKAVNSKHGTTLPEASPWTPRRYRKRVTIFE